MTAKKRQTKAEREQAEKLEAFKQELANLPAPGEGTKAAIAHSTAATVSASRRCDPAGRPSPR